MKELSKAYNPQEHEKAIYQQWLASGYFNPDNLPNAKRRKSFTISMPPPNATGVLHLGHAPMIALQDLIIRFERMRGRKTLWLPGTDHAAIATNAVVEKELKKEGLNKKDFGRDKFLERVNKFVKASQGRMREQTERMGASCDWSRERFTLDEGLSNAVRTAFVELYKDGLIYRGTRVVNWCPHCQSTLADDEVEYREEKAPFYYFRYGPVVIGTARPETKFQDKVIVVHPNDARYKDLVGKELVVEWIEGTVKATIIADTIVDPELGTGAMTITPAHSFEDFALAQRHGFAVVPIINKNGRMTNAAGSMTGLPVREARKRVVDILQQKGLVEKIDDAYVHNLSICYRCGTPIEPMPLEQWFVAVDKPTKKLHGKSLKQRALDVLVKNEIAFVPERFATVYKHWMENLHDWCISRQIWYGHQIPVWYKRTVRPRDLAVMGFHERVVLRVFDGMTSTYRLRDHGYRKGDRFAMENSQTQEIFGYGTLKHVAKTTVGEIPLVDPAHRTHYKNRQELIDAFMFHYPDKEVTEQTPVWIYSYTFEPTQQELSVGTEPPKGDGWIQDPDTLDTWFSSALWTFSTLGWPQDTKDLKTFHPTDVMETGYDIIFFWVARMIMMSTYFVKEIPFRTVYLHGLVRDKQGRKMSKSLGNGIDPLEMADKYGADAVRLSLIIGTTPGNDQKLYEEKIASFRNYANKLWNIGRFLQIQRATSSNQKGADLASPAPVSKASMVAWVRAETRTLADRWIASRLERLVEQTTKQLEDFSFGQAGEALYDFAWHDFADWYLEITKIEKNVELAHQTFRTLLILLHPFMPFVTETLWKELGYGKDLLMVEPWPKADRSRIDEGAEQEFVKLQHEITELRKEKKVAADAGSLVMELKRPADNIVWKYQELVEGLARIKTVKN